MHVDSRLKVLVLPSWYPNKLDGYTGDFIQRHIQAIENYAHQQVIFVIKDSRGLVTKDVLIEDRVIENVKEKIIYYNSPKTGIGVADKLISFLKYRKLYKKAVHEYINENGKPGIVHVHIAVNAGLIACWIKKKWKIPFVLSEQWTAYLPEALDFNVYDFSTVYRNLVKTVIKESALVTVVSSYLGKAIKQFAGKQEYTVIPNVVNTNCFSQKPKTASQKVRLIHISNMNYQKNTEAILAALKLWKDEDGDFDLSLYGPVQESLQTLINKSNLQDKVFLKGEVSQSILAKSLQESDLLILYSRFETFGCVLIEANASGVPVMVSDIEVFHEIVTQNENGFFVKGDDPVALKNALIQFSSGKETINPEQIALDTAEKYNYKKIGKQFETVYKKVVEFS